MNYLTKILVIVCLTRCFAAESLQEFTNYVAATIKQLDSFKFPTDNKNLFSTCEAKIQNYGQFDFVIIGAGSAGAVVANRLSEINDWSILLLEAGGELTEFSDVPAFNNYLQQTDMNWGYLTSPQTTCCQGMENHQCRYPRGKVLGGSSTLNGAVYARGDPDDYKEWVELGNKGWSYEDVLPYFKKSERVALKSYDKEYHGTKGLLYVNHTSPPSAVAEAFINANKEKGLPEVDYNGKQQLGVSRIQFNIKDNKHQNSARAFLDPIRATKKNLKILVKAAVNKVIINNMKVTGVTFVKDGVLHKVKANKEVILSAGSINTPQLLLLSGIGPEKELKKLGIPVQINLPAVGKHLQDHPLFVNMYFRSDVSAPNHSLQENLERYRQGLTPLTNGAGLENLAFLNLKNKSSSNVEIFTFAPPFAVPPNRKISYNFQDKFGKAYEKYNPTTDFSILVSLMKPKSEGSVTLKSNSILDFPLIDINYFSDPNDDDLDTLYEGIKYVLSLEKTEAFRKINARYISEQPGCEHLKGNDREFWYCALRHMTSTEYHPSSTTRMGPSPSDSVVDGDGLVHNVRRLRIIDAGIFPAITRGHLNSAVYMIAEKISDAIKAKYGKL